MNSGHDIAVDAHLSVDATSILESMTDAFFAIDGEWRLIYVNRRGAELAGYGPGELPGRNLWDAIAGLTGSEFESVYRQVAAERKCRWITGYLATQGRWYEVKVDPAPYGISLFFRDVTEQKRIETERLRLAEVSERQRRMYETALSNSADSNYVFDLQGRFLYANRVLLELWRKNLHEALGKTFSELDYYPKKVAEKLEQQIQQVIASRQPLHDEITFSTHSRRGVFEYIWVPVFDENDAVVAVTGSTRDVTKRRQAEQAIHDSDERYSVLFDSVPVAVFVCDRSGIIQSYNRRAAELWGREPVAGDPRERYCGSAKLYLPDGSLLPRDQNPMIEVLRTGVANNNVEAFLERPDGSHIPVIVNFAALRDVQGKITGAITSFDDMSELKQAQQEARRIAERFRFMAESMPQKIFTAKADGDIDYFNPQWSEYSGLSFERLREWGWTQVIHPDDLAENIRIWKHSLATGDPSHIEHRFRRSDGEYRWHLSRATAAKDADGKIIMWLGSNTDIHEVKEADRRKNELLALLRESEERFRTLADNMSQFAWMTDSKGLAFWYNQRWFDYTGTTLEDMRGWGWTQVHHPDHVERVVARIQHSWDTGELWEDLFPLRAKDGSYRWFLSRAVPVLDERGAVVRWLGTNTDVTEQRNAEESLRQADLHKDEFLAMLAHELRNPLAPIRNALQVMRLKHHDHAGFDAASAMMERQIVHIVRLVDDLMDTSRISRGKIELRRTRTELASIVYQAVEAARPPIEAMRHELSLDLPPRPLFLDADPVRLAQVIGNLLNNACKYTNEGGRIVLTVSVQHRNAVISVRDNGIGIAADQLSRIFEMFAQIDDSFGRTVGGLGIGLTLAQTLVEMHGGTIEAHSGGLGHGSEFVVQLPLLAESGTAAAGRSAATQASHSEAMPLTRRRILVVDDNQDAADSMAMLLMLEGDQARTAYDGQAALEAALEFRPEVVVLDLGLPNLNGYQVAQQLRMQPWGASLVLVALTGWGQSEARQKTAAAGFDGHLVKPVEVTTLNALLAEIALRRGQV